MSFDRENINRSSARKLIDRDCAVPGHQRIYFNQLKNALDSPLEGPLTALAFAESCVHVDYNWPYLPGEVSAGAGAASRG